MWWINHTTLHTFKMIFVTCTCLVQVSCCSEVKTMKKKKGVVFAWVMGAMISMENLENQIFTSKNHNLDEWDTNVKLPLISITLAAKMFSAFCCICKVSNLVGDCNLVRPLIIRSSWPKSIAHFSWSFCMWANSTENYVIPILCHYNVIVETLLFLLT